MEQARRKLIQILWTHRAAELSATMQQMLHKHCKASARTQQLIRFVKIVLLCVLAIWLLNYYHTELQGQRCALSLPRPLRYALRPPERCGFCANIESVPRLSDLSAATFETEYAYTGAPVIVSDAMQNWTATTLFNYEYFRGVYGKAKRKQRIRDCQFLPYKTGFQDIYEALDMPQSRIDLQSDELPWYFGWSNCNAETAEEFRKHYGRPYFLPERSENNAVDWFFIGTAGLGAQMHIDNVRLPSWQAQLAGSKRWLLVPPPECYFQCRRFEVVVQQGDIIVLDTNRWYHQTFVQPGTVSLTIGAEYD
ncbi:GH17492 [Drosophila grimshawi]|uniref:GH17492 n=1 Tax=Drosophila grimshawi TaxID=7222 RepID=B4JTV3_DROGR|nr:GH17492 [Drosophila grimshawi]